MTEMMRKYTEHMEKELSFNPSRGKKELLGIYKAFNFYQKHFPDHDLPKSKQYLADVCMDFFLNGMSHQEHSVLTSIFMPGELLLAFGLTPLCAEMISTFLNGAHSERVFVETAENSGISETFCSYHKIVMGASQKGLLDGIHAIVNSSLACDANNLTFRVLAHQKSIPQYYVDVPYERSEESVLYVMDQLRELTEALENLTGHALEEEKLKEICRRSAETIHNMNCTIPYRKERYLPNTLTTELYEALMLHNALGTREALKYSQMLLEDWQNAPEDHGRKIVWMHSNPFWQQPVRDLLNKNPEQHIIATELGYDAWQEGNPEEPYRFLAERLVYNPYNGPAVNRIERTRRMAEETDADGVVCFCHWGCKETCGASALIKASLEQSGYPVLILNGDGADRANASDGQTATRLGAFLEMLKENRK